jgi:1,4-dihydroxy-6-naphthoate synthase
MPRFTLAHSPDADDAFMFYALAKGMVATDGWEVEHVLSDIQMLNEHAERGTYEVTAISFHAYAYVHQKYRLVAAGGSFGEGYGPIVVSRSAVSSLRGRRVAVPGLRTSAYLLLKVYEPSVDVVVMPFDRILPAVADGAVDLGLLIHEGQLTFGESGLSKVVDLGEWWTRETGLPVPLGGNAVRRDMGDEFAALATRIIRDSVSYSLAHREEALSHALSYARGLARGSADRFVGMYVNARTLDCGPDGWEAVRLLLRRGREVGAIPFDPPVVP